MALGFGSKRKPLKTTGFGWFWSIFLWPTVVFGVPGIFDPWPYKFLLFLVLIVLWRKMMDGPFDRPPFLNFWGIFSGSQTFLQLVAFDAGNMKLAFLCLRCVSRWNPLAVACCSYFFALPNQTGSWAELGRAWQVHPGGMLASPLVFKLFSRVLQGLWQLEAVGTCRFCCFLGDFLSFRFGLTLEGFMSRIESDFFFSLSFSSKSRTRYFIVGASVLWSLYFALRTWVEPLKITDCSGKSTPTTSLMSIAGLARNITWSS